MGIITGTLQQPTLEGREWGCIYKTGRAGWGGVVLRARSCICQGQADGMGEAGGIAHGRVLFADEEVWGRLFKEGYNDVTTGTSAMANATGHRHDRTGPIWVGRILMTPERRIRTVMRGASRRCLSGTAKETGRRQKKRQKANK